MSYTNVDTGLRFQEEKFEHENHILRAELEYYKKKYQEAKRDLQNIPQAVLEHGYVDIHYKDKNEGSTIIKLEEKFIGKPAKDMLFGKKEDDD